MCDPVVGAKQGRCEMNPADPDIVTYFEYLKQHVETNPDPKISNPEYHTSLKTLRADKF